MGSPVEIVVALLLNEQERCYFQRRGAGGLWPWLWELPGGKREPGEPAQDAIIREVQEELSLGLDDFRIERRLITTDIPIQTELTSGLVRYSLFEGVIHKWAQINTENRLPFMFFGAEDLVDQEKNFNPVNYGFAKLWFRTQDIMGVIYDESLPYPLPVGRW